MLDILFDNPIIMAAIIAAISFIFNKLGKNDENEEAKRKPAPEQQRTQTPKPKQTAQHRPAKNKNQRPAAAAANSADMEAELRRIKEDAERSMPAVERTIKKQSSRVINRKQELLDMNKKTIVQGIVLSEVFGPPRSRKPHYTMRRRPKI
ncbi:hypothetical protein ACG2QI_05690 [Bacillus sp. GM2]|uniref:Uncharacterized protein n=2 Tax=Bacillus licheniformis TaxID=1402 RepID=Q65H65_BACLD|nr:MULTISPECIES: hypothetical protein [Bacillus]MBJ7883878.1 hypothetical protein [Bacillaceae bacterium HSR45]MBY8347260.1 hypothetical protein [Bacillus sp. PCH94]MDP4080256.1 hypothetical protein [Bacillota bacterium]AAU24237.1 conserved hypothetical protein YqfB [Bacillus licheniformis DSM 13 = ATCC 14580]AAU41599.1 YqfB [Bacillus licheniformis DSM 13 = ATCC 14580]